MTDDEPLEYINPFTHFKEDVPVVTTEVASKPVQLPKAIPILNKATLKDSVSVRRKSNVTRLSCSGDMYIVRTQAGFRRACKDFDRRCSSDGLEPNGFPTEYPSLISLSMGYRGYHFIEVAWIHLNDLTASLFSLGEV